MSSEPQSERSRYRLFEGVGVEIEYPIVDRETLKARPIADVLLQGEAGEPVNEVEHGETCWSNELVQHVLEIKSNGPARDLHRLQDAFAQDVRQINQRLSEHGAMLMPTAMHPLFVPAAETVLWPHEQGEIYRTYDRLFGCKGHGWANLQSTHLNLPFASDTEFSRLHAAIRLVLPLLPALAASSPFEEGKRTGLLDTRLAHYRENQARIPLIAGQVIPEQAYTEADYEHVIFEPMLNAVRPLDPGGVLEPEWLNSRGAIARFSRGAIEIRLLDAQECPHMDLAIASLVEQTLRALVDERWQGLTPQQSWPETRLAPMLFDAIAQGSDVIYADADYPALFGLPHAAMPARELLEHLIGELSPTWSRATLTRAVAQGCLAKRIVEQTGPEPTADQITGVYRELSQCLESNTPFLK